jgi:hypothetical protein
LPAAAEASLIKVYFLHVEALGNANQTP